MVKPSHFGGYSDAYIRKMMPPFALRFSVVRQSSL
jgi:hypothetical protein